MQPNKNEQAEKAPMQGYDKTARNFQRTDDESDVRGEVQDPETMDAYDTEEDGKPVLDLEEDDVIDDEAEDMDWEDEEDEDDEVDDEEDENA
jgi:hypothetical protein